MIRRPRPPLTLAGYGVRATELALVALVLFLIAVRPAWGAAPALHCGPPPGKPTLTNPCGPPELPAR